MLKYSSVYCLVIASICAQANAAENNAHVAPKSNSLQTSIPQDHLPVGHSLRLSMKHYLSLLSMILATGLSGWSYVAMADPIPEYEMKAAYLYNFATFTHWPTNTNHSAQNSAVSLCVFGSDSFGGALEKLTTAPSGGVRITLSYIASIKEANTCQILFIDASELKNSAQIIKDLDNSPILTVTDNHELFREGMMIGLFLDNKRLTFDVDYTLAQQAKLSISSKLLRVARSVKQ